MEAQERQHDRHVGRITHTYELNNKLGKEPQQHTAEVEAWRHGITLHCLLGVLLKTGVGNIGFPFDLFSRI